MKTYFFCKRPILAIVIALIIICSGIVASLNIAVSQFPNLSPPVIAIRAQFPGASAETAAKVVAAQIEAQLNGVTNLLYMATTTSATGSISINLTYEIGTDLNTAINEALNRIYAAMSLLPPVVQQLGVTARKSSPDQLLSIAFYSDPYLDPKFVSNYLQRTVENDLLRLSSVGNISVFGSGTYALRIWLDPNKIERYHLSIDEIQAAIRDQNQEYVIGRTNSVPFLHPNSSPHQNMLSLNIKGGQMFTSANQVANIVLRNQHNQVIHLKDIARVELGANNYTSLAKINFREANGTFKNYPASLMQVYLVPDSNQLLAKQQILTALEEDAKSFPFGLHYQITNDNSRFARASLNNVIEALEVAVVLVGLIILWFLRDWRAALIISATIPVAMLGTIICLYLCGFSLNTLSLFALILAVGIVVDDAIIIVENIERLKIEFPQKSLNEIIYLTMQEVFKAIIAIILVLSVVFIPIMNLSGLSGVMYRQFAVTIACAIIFSGISALTFIPALSKQFLRQGPRTRKKLSKKYFWRFSYYYIRLANYIILKRKLVIFIWLAIISLTYFLFRSVSTDFVPLEDQGVIMASMNLPTASSLKTTENTANQLLAKLTQNSNITSALSVIGMDFLDSGGQKNSAASFFIVLKDWSNRIGKHSSADAIIQQINHLNRAFPGITLKAFNQPPMRGLSTTGGVEFYLEDRALGDPRLLQKIANDLIQRLKKHHAIASAYQTLDTTTLQMSLTPDIDRVKMYGANLTDVYNILRTMYSNNNVNYAYLMQDLIWVIMEADFPYRATLDGLKNVYIRNNSNQMLPILNVLKVTPTTDAQVIQRFNNYIASKITVNPAKGYTMGDVMQIIDQEITTIPKGYNYEWFGTSYQLKQSQQTSILAFSLAFIMIYLVLAALFEKWRLPLVILMGVPYALFGAILILKISSFPNDLYFQISLVTLLGLSAKNIILLVEFALQYYQRGHSAKSSAIMALKVRLRPIFMTSITFIGGTLPLVFAHGAGANAEHSLGLGIIGGVVGSLFLATLFTPAYFVLIMPQRLANKNTCAK